MKKSEFDMVLATPAQIKETQAEIRTLEGLLNDTSHVGQKIQSPNEIREEISKKKDLIEAHKPRRLRGQKASRAYAEAKELKAKIAEAMPSSEMYFQRSVKKKDDHSKTVDFENAVRMQTKFQTDPSLQRDIARYKNIMGRLDPDDPTLTNIEMLRR